MDVFSLVSYFIAFIIAITIHESAHAWMGNKLGDPTAKELGRISLNPLKHIDPIGTILLPLLGLLSPAHSFFGWAKPTPFNPDNLKETKKDELLIALAGPFSNFLLSGFFYLLIVLCNVSVSWFHLEVSYNAFNFIYINVVENLVLAFFNILPIPPLDGSTILKIFVPKKFSMELAFFNNFGFLILYMISSASGNFIGRFVNTCVDNCLTILGLQ